MRRILVPLVLLVGLAVLVLTLRVQFAQFLLPWLVQSRGIAFSADVTELDHRQIELRRVTVDGLTADSVAVRFRLTELVAGRVESVRVEGMALDVDLSGTQEPAAAPAEGGVENAGFPVSSVPEVELVDARLRFLLPVGECVLTAQATLQQRDAGALEFTARFDVSTPWLPLRGRLVSRFQGLQPLSLELELAPRGDPALATGRVAVAMAALDRVPELTITTALSLGPESTVLLPVDSGITLGNLQLSHTMALRPGAPLVLAGEHATSIPDWLGTADGEAAMRIDVRALGSATRFQNLSGTGAISLARGRGGLRLTVSEPFTLSAGTVQRDWLEQFALPTMVEQLLARGGTLQLAPDGGGPPLLEIRPDGSVHRALAAGTLKVRSGETRLGLDVALASVLPAVDLAGALAALPSMDQAEGRFAFAVENLDVPELLRVRSGQIAGEVSVRGDDLAVSLSGESAAVIELAESTTAAAGARPLTAMLGGPIDLRIGPLDVTRPSIHIRRTGSQTRLLLAHSVDARLLGGPAVAGLLEGAAELDAQLSLTDFNIARLGLDMTGLDLGAATVSQLAVRGRAAGAAERFSGALQIELKGAGLRGPSVVAEAIDASLDLGFGLEGGRWRAAVDRPATARINALSLPGRVASPAGITIGLQQGSVTLAPDGIVRLQGLAGGVEPLSVAILREPDPPLALELSSMAWSAGGTANLGTGDVTGQALVRLARMLAPDQALALEHIDLALEAGSDAPVANLRAARLVGAGEASLIPALALSGTVEAAKPGYRFTFLARGANDRLELHGDGEHGVASGRGRATLSIAPMSFLPGELQPRDLSPELAVLNDVSGRVEARVELGWDAGELDGTGVLGLQDVAFDYQATRVQGLNLELAFEHLFPLTSQARQKLRVARIDLGFPIMDLDAALTVLSSEAGPPYILVEQLSAAALGGRVLLPEARIDPFATQQRLTLELDPVELAALTDVIALEEIKGRGRLVGRFPVRVEGEELIIEGGRLQASEPGTLSFRSAQTRQTLAPAGESLDLMLQALEDFHYDSLTMTVDKPAAGESKFVLRLTGNNPAVLDGQPFDFTINLSGDLTPLLATLAQGNRLSSDLLRRIWRLRR